MGRSAVRAPNQGEDGSFCCWIAGQWLARKECFFTDTGSATFFSADSDHSDECLIQLCPPRVVVWSGTAPMLFSANATYFCSARGLRQR